MEGELAQQSAKDTANVQEAVSMRSRRVLVIDDDAAILNLIRHSLNMQFGCMVSTAANGAEGLQTFARERPDCVVVDVNMPLLDGFQVVRAIRGDSATAQTPIIILSALTEEWRQLTGALSGVDEYVPKPFKPSELCACIERVLKITPEERMLRIQRLAEDEA